MKNMMIRVDLAKNIFQTHGVLRTGEVQFRKKLTRTQFPVFMAQQEPCWLSSRHAAPTLLGAQDGSAWT